MTTTVQNKVRHESAKPRMRSQASRKRGTCLKTRKRRVSRIARNIVSNLSGPLSPLKCINDVTSGITHVTPTPATTARKASTRFERPPAVVGVKLLQPKAAIFMASSSTKKLVKMFSRAYMASCPCSSKCFATPSWASMPSVAQFRKIIVEQIASKPRDITTLAMQLCWRSLTVGLGESVVSVVNIIVFDSMMLLLLSRTLTCFSRFSCTLCSSRVSRFASAAPLSMPMASMEPALSEECARGRVPSSSEGPSSSAWGAGASNACFASWAARATALSCAGDIAAACPYSESSPRSIGHGVPDTSAKSSAGAAPSTSFKSSSQPQAFVDSSFSSSSRLFALTCCAT
mmetsp:Transcript_114358/g.330374  ORF Transcript_114358/g.330374 Transcript_114358/m.330374 type:complete len:345 (-) Transcript_114358:131-1165(-)